MIYQLPNGRIIEMSLDQYLDLTDEELKDLNGLGNEYSSNVRNPFYKSALGKTTKEKEEIIEVPEEYEPGIDEISKDEIINDEYYHRDDV
tara:strand:- start:1631 stop:1900 length:270 start_codon:yes stop_codon:yes gene_type:complete